MYCDFPTKARLPHKSQPRPARSTSSRRLCVLRLPHKSQPRPSGAHARSSSSRRLCVLRLPHESQPLCGKGMR